MSPSLALQSPVFRFYVTAALGLLSSAGVILGVLKWGLHSNVRHAWQAYCGWLLIVPILLLGFFLGREASIALITSVAILGFLEFALATDLNKDRVIVGVVCAGVILTGIASTIDDPWEFAHGWYGLFTALPVLVIAVIMVV